MPKVTHIKSARKDIYVHGELVVKKGEEYYHWTPGFRGRKRVSKTYPTRRELTVNDHELRIMDLEDARDGIELDDPESMKSAVEDLVSQVEEYKEELESNLESVPEQLQESHVNTERIEALQGAIDELEGIDFDNAPDDDPDDPADDAENTNPRDAWAQEKLEEIRGVSFS